MSHAIAAFKLTQTRPTLAEYLESHPCDAGKKGPMIVIDRGRTPQLHDNKGSFNDFGRQAMPCGTITAIAPDRMVIIDDSLKDTPSL